MAVKLETARSELKEIQGVIAAIKVAASPEFVADALNIEGMGRKSLAFMKRIFPRSPRSYPYAAKDRESLVQGWTVFPHPPKSFGVNKGFTLRRKSSDLRDHEIIAALDQGSRAYDRIIPFGQKVAFLNTNRNPDYPKTRIGSMVFLTGNGKLFHYTVRHGLHFMDATYNYTLGLIEEAKGKFKSKVRGKIRSARR